MDFSKRHPMNRRHFTVASLVTLALLATSACGGGGKTYPDYRYRLTVEVDTPEGLKRGSSVIEVKTRRASQNAIPSPGLLSHKVRGEAVTVDLGARGVMFALLRSDTDNDWASRVLFALARTVSFEEIKGREANTAFDLRFNDMMSLKGAQVLPRYFRDLPPNGKDANIPTAYPMLVRFGDIADPKTVAKVDPDDLAASFGKGVTLRRITIERTKDQVTTGIERRLGWLPTQKGQLVKASLDAPYADRLLSDVSDYDFSRGL
jgi:hypothetical protein